MNVTREELAEVLLNLDVRIGNMSCGGGGEALAVRGALRKEADRLSPPKVEYTCPVCRWHFRHDDGSIPVTKCPRGCTAPKEPTDAPAPDAGKESE